MQDQTPPRIRDGLYAAVPIMLGYFPIAFSFGVASSRAGLNVLETAFLSLVIYSGAAQFLALALITSGAPVLVAGGTLIAMGLRHLLYGPAIMKEAGPHARKRFAAFWGWGLTDEVFGQAIGALSRGLRFSEGWIFGLGLAAYATWVLGSIIGAWAGGGVLDAYPAVSAGLSFMLAALFLSILMSIANRRSLPVIAVAAGATVLGSLLLSPTSGILAGMVAGALTGVILPPQGDKA